MEVGLDGGEIGRQLRTHLVDISEAAETVVFLQAYLDKRRMHPRVGRVDRREVRRHADVRDDHIEVFGSNDGAHVFLYPCYVPVREFYPGTRRGFNTDDELTGVRPGEIRPA